MRKINLSSQAWTFFILILLLVTKVSFFLKSIDFNPTSLQVVINSHTGPDPFYKGDIFSIDYISRYSNFGIVEVRFNTFDQISTDLLEFRIKERGQNDWYYRAEYKVDQFQNSKLFPFGFPIIKESENRTYHIEIESQRGVVGDMVAQSGVEPRIVSRHVFGKKLLFSQPRFLFRFIVLKVVNLVGFQEFFTSFVLFAMPLIIYLVYLVIGSGVGLFSSVLLVLTTVDVFWIQNYYSYFLLSTVFGWFLVMRKHRITYMVPALVGMLLFILVPLSYFFGLETMANKLGIWTLLFLCLAAFQMGYEVFTHLDQTMTLHQYRKNFLVETWNTLLISWLMAIGQVTLMTEVSKVHGYEGARLRQLSKEEYDRRVTLIVKRFGAPMIDTYLITSRFISFLIRSLVVFINYAFRLGPYLVSIWLVRLSVKNLSNYANFFQFFFITDQSGRYWHSIGYYLVFVYLFTTLIFLIIQRKKDLRVKIYYLVAILLISLNVSRIVFNLATASYRDKPTIWAIRPNQTAEPWVDVTIVGRNFGEKPFDGRVFIDGVEQRVIDWRTNEIIFRTNPVTTKTGNLSIKTRQKEPSNPIMFIYTGDR